MDAQVIMRLAQENPRQYDGALPMCGPMGGSQLEIDYLMNVRVLFDYFYPGVIPGDAVHVPAGLDCGTDVVPAVLGAIFANPASAFELADVDQVDIHYADFGELIESILTGLFFNTLAEFMGDLRERTHGHDNFDNTRGLHRIGQRRGAQPRRGPVRRGARRSRVPPALVSAGRRAHDAGADRAHHAGPGGAAAARRGVPGSSRGGRQV
jgi:hypothetical protein